MVFWNQKQLKLTGGKVILSLSPDTQVAVSDIDAHVPQHIWPPIVLGDEFQHFEVSGVTSYSGVMAE